VIASGCVIDDEMKHAELFSGERTRVLPELNNMLEEADLQIVPHVNWAVQNGAKRVVVLSNDTDVVALLLRFMSHWKSAGYVTCG
jgi:DTW domain-containing protein YfiP